jgi:hypothetical protein
MQRAGEQISLHFLFATNKPSAAELWKPAPTTHHTTNARPPNSSPPPSRPAAPSRHQAGPVGSDCAAGGAAAGAS